MAETSWADTVDDVGTIEARKARRAAADVECDWCHCPHDQMGCTFAPRLLPLAGDTLPHVSVWLCEDCAMEPRELQEDEDEILFAAEPKRHRCCYNCGIPVTASRMIPWRRYNDRAHPCDGGECPIKHTHGYTIVQRMRWWPLMPDHPASLHKITHTVPDMPLLRESLPPNISACGEGPHEHYFCYRCAAPFNNSHT